MTIKHIRSQNPFHILSPCQSGLSSWAVARCRISSSLDIGLKLSAVTFSTTLSGISATCWPWTLELLSMAHASVGDNLQLMLQKTWMVAVFRHTLDIVG